MQMSRGREFGGTRKEAGIAGVKRVHGESRSHLVRTW